MTDGRRKPKRRRAAAVAAPAVELRRAPVQERALRQVQRILDAAAALIAEAGVEVATTNAVAARAGVSVGSLYQYFPNKEGLVRALALRFIDALDALLPVPAGDDPTAWSLPEEVERSVEVLARFIAANPAYVHVYRAARAAGDDVAAHLLDRGKAHFEGIFARRAPHVPKAERRVHATVVVEAAQALFVVADSLPPAERGRIRRELTTMLVRYLEPVYGRAVGR